MATLKDRRPRLGGRDQVWAVIRVRAEPWTVADISRATGQKVETIREYVCSLERAGIVACVGEADVPEYREITQLKRKVYSLARDLGVDAPRVRKDGSPIPPSGRERMWRALRILGEFTVSELVGAASQGGPAVAEGEARSYCNTLVLGGYLRRVASGRYRFIPSRNTGGRAPQILRVKKLYDPNTGLVVWESAARQGEDDA